MPSVLTPSTASGSTTDRIAWKLVPVEPTIEMLRALYQQLSSVILEPTARNLYANMLACTPSPPSVEAGRGEREALERAADVAQRAIDLLGEARSGYIGGSSPDEAWDKARADLVSDLNALRDAALQGNGEAIIDHERIFAECYQAVGALIYHYGLGDNADCIRLQDMLAYGKTEDGKELLPWPHEPLPAPPSNSDGVREALAACIDYVTEYADQWERKRVGLGAYEACSRVRSVARKALDLLPTLPSRTGLEEAAEWPQARGVSRDADSEQALVVHFDRRLTDDEMRNVHEALRTRAPKTTAPAAEGACSFRYVAALPDKPASGDGNCRTCSAHWKAGERQPSECRLPLRAPALAADREGDRDA